MRPRGRLVDRAIVVVEAGELRRRVRLGHDQRRRAVAAADVGDARARQQLRLDAVERRDPRLHEVRAVAGPEEPLAAFEQRVVVLVPADAGPAAERLGDLRLVAHGGRHQLEGAGEERRAVLVGERDRVLGGQRVAAVLVGHVAAGGLRAQPLAHVALAGAGALRELARRERACSRHRLVEPEPVADHDERRVQRRPELADRLVHERVRPCPYRSAARPASPSRVLRRRCTLADATVGGDLERSHQEGTWAFAGSAPIASASSARELIAELAVDVAQVVVDGLRAEEQLRRRLARRVALGEHERDLELARRQLVERARVALARRLAGGEQLGPGALRPRRRAELVEGVDGAAQLLARLHAPARAPQPLAVAQARAGLLEAVGRQRVQAERLLEAGAQLRRAGEQAAAARQPRERPRLALGGRALGELVEPAGGVLDAVDPHQRLDQLGDRRHVGVGDAALGEQPLLLLQQRDRRLDPAEPELELGERVERPQPEEREAELAGQRERVAGVLAAGLLAALARLDAREPRQAGAQRRRLARLARQPDHLLVERLGDRQPIAGRRVAGGQPERERQRADRALAARRLDRARHERAALRGLAEPQRAERRRGEEPRIARERVGALEDLDGVAQQARRPPRRARCRSAPSRARASRRTAHARRRPATARPTSAGRRAASASGRAAYRQASAASASITTARPGSCAVACSAASTRMSWASTTRPERSAEWPRRWSISTRSTGSEQTSRASSSSRSARSAWPASQAASAAANSLRDRSGSAAVRRAARSYEVAAAA